MAMAPISPVNDMLTKIANAQMLNDKKILNLNVTAKIDAATQELPDTETQADAGTDNPSRLDVHV